MQVEKPQKGSGTNGVVIMALMNLCTPSGHIMWRCKPYYSITPTEPLINNYLLELRLRREGLTHKHEVAHLRPAHHATSFFYHIFQRREYGEAAQVGTRDFRNLLNCLDLPQRLRCTA